jgi:hypothetical protein
MQRLGLTETVIYRPDGGAALTIQATVDRGSPEAFMQGQTSPGLTVCVLNDAALGIDAETLDVGADRIDVAKRVGVTAEARGIQQVVSQDSDFLTLAVM